MTTRVRTVIESTTVGGLLIAAAVMGISRLQRVPSAGDEGLQIWFYDESEQTLYTVPRDTFPPHEGIGGKRNDGVRAVVVAARDECLNPDKRRIAYLETYTPEHKKLMVDLQAAWESGRPYDKPIPSAESDFYQKNTLVRRVDDPTWHDMTTPEAGQIVTEWLSHRCPGGVPTVICTPESQ